MSKAHALPVENLIREFSRFPGVGEKSAARLAAFILKGSAADARRLAEAIIEVKEKITFCRSCFNLAEEDLCRICRDGTRDAQVVCVVEEPEGLVAIEECGTFPGVFHVLHGALAPLEGIGPDQLKLRELMDRIEREQIREIIIATNPTVNGDSTALLICRMLEGSKVGITRIALGVPMGSDLKYLDKMTLAKSIEYRREIPKAGVSVP